MTSRRSRGDAGVAENIAQRQPPAHNSAWLCTSGCPRHDGRFPSKRRSDSQDKICVDRFCYIAHSDNDGSSIEVFKAYPENMAATSAALAFGAFSKHHPNTRLISLKGLHFYAFTSPHSNTSQIVVWRRLGDAVSAGFKALPDEAQCIVRFMDPAESLSCGRSKVGPIPDLYRRQGYDKNAWVFSESFWCPNCNGSTQRFEHQWNAESRTKGVPGNARNPLEGQGPNMEQATPAQDMRDRDSRAEAFDLIYRKDVWPGILSKSGPGSDPFHPMVRIAITALDAVVDALSITSMLDAACGDAGWINASFLSRRPQLKYVGIDIVAHVVEENQRRYPSHTFMTVDLGDGSSQTTLPFVELVFSKETLNHMFVQDAVHALCHLRSTGAKYLLTNIARGAPNNRGALKMTHANYYPYDYSLPPFNLRKIAPIIDINVDDWSEYALFSL